MKTMSEGSRKEEEKGMNEIRKERWNIVAMSAVTPRSPQHHELWEVRAENYCWDQCSIRELVFDVNSNISLDRTSKTNLTFEHWSQHTDKRSFSSLSLFPIVGPQVYVFSSIFSPSLPPWLIHIHLLHLRSPVWSPWAPSCEPKQAAPLFVWAKLDSTAQRDICEQ